MKLKSPGSEIRIILMKPEIHSFTTSLNMPLKCKNTKHREIEWINKGMNKSCMKLIEGHIIFEEQEFVGVLHMHVSHSLVLLWNYCKNHWYVYLNRKFQHTALLPKQKYCCLIQIKILNLIFKNVNMVLNKF
jgi:hypothetical protein